MPSVPELMDLRGRVALVSGGAGHIGTLAGRTLAELGASVAVLDRVESDCRRVADAIRAETGVDAVGIAADLASEEATRAAVRQTIERLGRLDVLVHSAAWLGGTTAAGWTVPFAQQTVEAWDQALRVNLTAAFVLVQEAAPVLARSGHGSVILLGSIYGVVGPDASLYAGTAMTNPWGYGASKGGLLQLVRYGATTLAPHVRVNAISPGGIWRGHLEVFHARYRARTPLGRMATEEDLKGAVAYLASDLSAYVTGHNLLVDGGWTAW